MKRLTTHLVIAAAALTAVAASAPAQTLKAEVPFSFRAGKALMQPGAYDVQILRAAGNTQFLIRNKDTKQAVFILPMLEPDAPKAWKADGKARLSFECAESQCALRELWTGINTAYYMPGPRVESDGHARVTEVILTKTNVE